MSRWRMTNRVLAGIYDEELRPFGLKSPQLNLLVAVAKAGPVRRTRLGELFALDPSTLTRNLQVMLRQGWIAETPDDVDQRGAPLKITAKGAKLLESIGPAWQRAQARGLSEHDYMGGNLLGREVTADDVAQAFLHQALELKTTGDVTTVDGGNIAAALR